MNAGKILCERLSSRGYSVGVLEDNFVPRIRDEYLDCVIYLYHSKQDAERCVVHESGGSGFLVSIPSISSTTPHVYAVSNRHIVEKSPVIRLNTMKGESDVIPVDASKWVFTDEHDIAVCYLSLPSDFRYKVIEFKQFITPDIIERQRIGPGDDVFIIGRFVNHEGRQRNLPSARFGNVAMMPDEPIRHNHRISINSDYHDVREYNDVSFLVDIRTVSGYSGSPVFISYSLWCALALDQ